MKQPDLGIREAPERHQEIRETVYRQCEKEGLFHVPSPNGGNGG